LTWIYNGLEKKKQQVLHICHTSSLHSYRTSCRSIPYSIRPSYSYSSSTYSNLQTFTRHLNRHTLIRRSTKLEATPPTASFHPSNCFIAESSIIPCEGGEDLLEKSDVREGNEGTDVAELEGRKGSSTSKREMSSEGVGTGAYTSNQ
jgi:hypothetical protein